MNEILFRNKNTFQTFKMHLETSTCDPVNYKMGEPTIFVSIRIEKSIRIKMINAELKHSNMKKNGIFDSVNSCYHVI